MMERAAGIEHARMQALTLLDKFGVESLEHVRIDAFARRLAPAASAGRLAASARPVTERSGRFVR